MKIQIILIMLLAAFMSVYILVGCEDENDQDETTTISTEVLPDGSIRTLSEELIAQPGGAIITQTIATVTYPNGTTVTQAISASALSGEHNDTSIASGGAYISVVPQTYTSELHYVPATNINVRPDLPTNGFPYRPPPITNMIVLTNSFLSPDITNSSFLNPTQEDGYQNTSGVIITEGVPNKAMVPNLFRGGAI